MKNFNWRSIIDLQPMRTLCITFCDKQLTRRLLLIPLTGWYTNNLHWLPSIEFTWQNNCFLLYQLTVHWKYKGEGDWLASLYIKSSQPARVPVRYLERWYGILARFILLWKLLSSSFLWRSANLTVTLPKADGCLQLAEENLPSGKTI